MKCISILMILATNVSWILGLPPIVMVPGITGSQLEARVSFGLDSAWWCNTRGWMRYWKRIWFPHCIIKVLKLEYDEVNNTYSNTSHVEIRVPGFGETKIIEYTGANNFFPYFHEFVDFFRERGYTNKTIRGAPYDWRLAADELDRTGYYDKLRNLIEEMYQENEEKVTIVAHSMGGVVSLYFFNRVVTQEWKDQYINAFIPLSGAWSGGNMAIPVILTGLKTGLLGHILSPLHEALRSLESALWMLPNPQVWGDKVLVTTTTKEYSANQYQEMFTDIGMEEDYKRLEEVLKINGNYPAPNVPVYCFYGDGVPTPETFTYGTGFPGRVTNVTTGNGDGVVNSRSSEVCLNWKNQTAPFLSRAFMNVDHNEIKKDKDVMKAIADILGVENSMER